MKVITKRDVIKSVLSRYQEQYKNYRDDQIVGVGAGRASVGETKRLLSKLDLDKCTEADVDAAIGTKGWASLTCDECHEKVDALIHIGDEPDYEAQWQMLCANCIKKAADMLTRKALSVNKNGRTENPTVAPGA